MAAQTQILSGIRAVLYKNSGSYASPTWGAQNNIRSVTPGYPWDFADAPSRATPIKIYAKTQVDLAIQVMMRADPADANYAAWVDASLSGTAVLDLLILNAKLATEGARGLRGEFLLSLVSEAQEIEGTIVTTFDLKPTITTNGLPKSAVMGASSVPTFSEITM